MSEADSLEAFAAKRPKRAPGRPCWACGIPEAEEINSARRKEITLRTIRDWLIEQKGYAPEVVTMTRLQNHFGVMRHHERES